jgi:hypothetical protein
MESRGGIESGSYDPLIDAEREALSRTGGRVHRVALIKAFREATGLNLRDAKRAVNGYLARRGGRITSDPVAVRPAGWIDDLLDAERAAAARDDRTVTKLLLVKALREASGLGQAQARLAVDHYLKRRGGEGLPSGSRAAWFAWLAVLLLAVGAFLIWAFR